MNLQIPSFLMKMYIPEILLWMSDNNKDINNNLEKFKKKPIYTNFINSKEIFLDPLDPNFEIFLFNFNGILFDFYYCIRNKEINNNYEILWKKYVNYRIDFERNYFKKLIDEEKNLNVRIDFLAGDKENIEKQENDLNRNILNIRSIDQKKQKIYSPLKEIIEKNKIEIVNNKNEVDSNIIDYKKDQKTFEKKKKLADFFLSLFKSEILFIYMNIEFLRRVTKSLEIKFDEDKYKHIPILLDYLDEKIFEYQIIETNRIKKISSILNAIEKAFNQYLLLRGPKIALEKFNSFFEEKSPNGFKLKKDRNLKYFMDYHEEYLYYLINTELFCTLFKLRGNAGFIKYSESEKYLSFHLENANYEKFNLIKYIDPNNPFEIVKSTKKICKVVKELNLINKNYPFLIMDSELNLMPVDLNFKKRYYHDGDIYSLKDDFIKNNIAKYKLEFYGKEIVINNKIYASTEIVFFEILDIFSMILLKNKENTQEIIWKKIINNMNGNINNSNIKYITIKELVEGFNNSIKNKNITASEYEKYRKNIMTIKSDEIQRSLLKILDENYEKNMLNLRFGKSHNFISISDHLPKFVPGTVSNCIMEAEYFIRKNLLTKILTKIPTNKRFHPKALVGGSIPNSEKSSAKFLLNADNLNLSQDVKNFAGKGVQNVNLNNDISDVTSIRSATGFLAAMNTKTSNSSIDSILDKTIKQIKNDCDIYIKENDKYLKSYEKKHGPIDDEKRNYAKKLIGNLIRTDSKAHKVNELRKLVTNGITLASLNATIENIKKIENRTLIHSPAAGGMTPIYIPNNIPTSKVTVYGKLILYRDLYLKALNQDQQMQNKKI